MTNQEIADILLLTAKLLELHGENPFKIKAYENAVFELEKFPQEVSVLLAEGKFYELPFTKSTIEKFKEIIQTGTLSILKDLLLKTPQGVIEMFNIQGLGPKKIQTIWLRLGIDNLGDLLHACYENRLKEVKGFGQKTQDSIRKAIEFYYLSKGKLHLHTAFEWLEWFKSHFPFPIHETGTLLTWDNFVDILEFVTTATVAQVKSILSKYRFLIIDEDADVLTARNLENVTVQFYFCSETDIENTIFLHATTSSHNVFIKYNPNRSSQTLRSLYANFPFVILPPHRYDDNCFEYYQRAKGNFIKDEDIKGLVHCHSQYSDGKHSLQEMANACIKMGYEYMVISDHSQSAFYANGLSPARLETQWNEIDKLNAQFTDFFIFKGIEADILADGSLDYDEDILKRLDCVIASIHSHFKMDIQQATQRIIKAIENPYTRILGHPTGRLLLIREGYPIDYEKIIDACVQNQVAIEINANPYRLDLDWKWLRKAVDKGVSIFINPDAHSVEGIQDIQWGIKMAYKAFLTPNEIVNTRNLQEFKQWLRNK